MTDAEIQQIKAELREIRKWIYIGAGIVAGTGLVDLCSLLGAL